jgi:hypothetical protein
MAGIALFPAKNNGVSGSGTQISYLGQAVNFRQSIQERRFAGAAWAYQRNNELTFKTFLKIRDHAEHLVALFF